MYGVTRRLYFGCAEMIKASTSSGECPPGLPDFLAATSVVPMLMERWKASACRKGAIRTLALAKAYYPNLDPAKLTKGFPEFQPDGTETSKIYGKLVKSVRRPACQITNGLALNEFQAAYDEDNHAIQEVPPEPINLWKPVEEAPQLFTPFTTSANPSSSTPDIPAPSRPSDLDGFEALSSVVLQRPRGGITKDTRDPGQGSASAPPHQ